MAKKRGLTMRLLGCAMAAAILWFNFTPQVQSLRLLPEQINMVAGGVLEWNLFFPVRVDIDTPVVGAAGSRDERLADVGATPISSRVSLSADTVGDTRYTVKLFGVIPVKSVTVKVAPERLLIPGGQAVGIALHTEGVLVVGIAEVGTRSPARDAGIQAGDWILEAGGIKVENSGHLTQLLEKAGVAGSRLRIRRGQATLEVAVLPARDGPGGTFRIGAWVRDSTAGVGTLSFIDKAAARFGALGHAVTDGDTHQQLSVSSGSVFLSQIVSINKGKRGQPGELRGIFPESKTAVGSIDTNTDYGLYGAYTGSIEPYAPYSGGLPIGTRAGIVEGPATILTTIDERGVREYACSIVHLSPQTAPATRSLVLEITDAELLAATGGIVQGMSGSPIIQNGHIIGAVTHVYVNDPTRGYGLYIEWMLENGIDKFTT